MLTKIITDKGNIYYDYSEIGTEDKITQGCIHFSGYGKNDIVETLNEVIKYIKLGGIND